MKIFFEYLKLYSKQEQLLFLRQLRVTNYIALAGLKLHRVPPALVGLLSAG